jgi:hypothetical protein
LIVLDLETAANYRFYRAVEERNAHSLPP